MAALTMIFVFCALVVILSSTFCVVVLKRRWIMVQLRWIDPDPPTVTATVVGPGPGAVKPLDDGGPGPSQVFAATPMIVIAADESARGELMPYAVLAEACGNWAADRVIGTGQAASVYRAQLPRFGTVAVKRFRKDRDGASRDFARELDALCSCRHPNVLEIAGRSHDGPENLIVMPLMEGGTLGAALPRLRWDARSLLMGQVVTAVSFLHGKSMLHRDIKSSNILLDRGLRQARLADFSLAKEQVRSYSAHGSTGVVVGSPGYMAPELMMRAASDKTDAYALGVVFLEVLTGLPAWDASLEGGMALTDRVVPGGEFKASLLDKQADWPTADVATVAEQAVALTSFDPGRRRTAAVLEQDAAYRAHLDRATRSLSASDAPSGTVIGAAGRASE